MTFLEIMMTFLEIITIFVGFIVWVLIGTAGIVLIVCAIDGCTYGGPRFRDWRDPVFTLGGVSVFVAIWGYASYYLLTCLR